MNSPSEIDLQMTLQGNLSELPRMNAQIQSWGEHRQWTQETIFQTQFVLEELFVNALKHGRIEGRPLRAFFALNPTEKGLAIQWRDNGIEFNPLLAPLANPHASLEERQPGGWGLTMLRDMTQETHYQRDAQGQEEINHLTWLLPWRQV